MKAKLLLILFFSWGLPVTAVTTAEIRGYRLPSDWYRLPEQGSPSLEAAEPRNVAQTIARMMEATGELVATMKVDLPNGQPGKNETPWHLGFMKTDLAVSASGLLGFLVLQGSSGVSLRWLPKKAAPGSTSLKSFPATEKKPTVLHLTSLSSLLDIHAQLDPFIEFVSRGGMIQNTELFKSNLYKEAEKFWNYSKALNQTSGNKWKATAYRRELDVDVSGMVSVGTSVGTQLQIRFQWERVENGVLAPTPPDVQALEKLVQAISEDLDVIANETFAGTGFVPHEINIGLGVTAGGVFGIAKASVSAIGNVLFSNDVKPPFLKGIVRRSSEAISLIVDKPSKEEIQYAELNGIRMQNAGRDGLVDGIIFWLDRVNFRNGLRKAAKLGKSMVQGSLNVGKSQWDLYELAVSYQISVGGLFGLVTVGTLANAELDLYNTNFHSR